MAYTKRPAGGTKIERSTVTTANMLGPWEPIPGVTGDITLPGGQSSKVDITTHDDVITFGGFRQNGAGLADTTDTTFEMLFDPDDTVHQALLADFSARTARDYRITFPGGVVRKYGTRAQISIGNGRAEINGYIRYTVTLLANTVNFNVA